GQSIVQQAVSSLQPDINFTFLNKTYENDVYVREPITGNKVRVSCVRFKATSGFRFAAGAPTYVLTTQGLTVTHRIAKIDADAMTMRFQLGPCADIASGYGVRIRDAKVTYKARPTIRFEDGACKVSLNWLPGETRVDVGDINHVGIQNDLERLAKDAVIDGLNSTLVNFFNSGLGSGLARASTSVCGSRKPGR
ncbi:MAG: hypothetical protein ACT4O5_16080, partial [Gammaproteobacteria bacterium]